MTTTIPKSLHTVTVLVAVARTMRQHSDVGQDYVSDALRVLGYADTPDTYELASKARAILHKEACRAAAAARDSRARLDAAHTAGLPYGSKLSEVRS